MIIEQQPPLEYFVNPNQDIAYEQVYDGGARLMTAALTNRPYAAVMFRDYIPASLAIDMQSPDRQISDAARKQTDYLEPLNHAMHDVWAANPPHPTLTPDNLDYHHEVDHNHTVPHTDQLLTTTTKPVVPLLGPATAIATIFGNVNFSFWVYPVNALNAADHADFDKAIDFPDKLIVKLPRHQITAHQRDLLAFTNLPPTIHMAQSSVARLSIVSFSYLSSKESAQKQSG